MVNSLKSPLKQSFGKSFNDLPYELLPHIAKHLCSSTDWNHFSLLNKECNTAANEALKCNLDIYKPLSEEAIAAKKEQMLEASFGPVQNTIMIYYRPKINHTRQEIAAHYRSKTTVDDLIKKYLPNVKSSFLMLKAGVTIIAYDIKRSTPISKIRNITHLSITKLTPLQAFISFFKSQ